MLKEIWPPDPAAAKVLRSRPAAEGRIYRLSQYAFPFRAEGRSFLFHTLTRECVEIGDGALPEGPFAYAGAGGGEALGGLIARRFFVPWDLDECALYGDTLRVLRAVQQRKKTSHYTILPTTGCNARCVYCFEEGMAQITMTPETARDTVAFILKSRDPARPVRLNWFGGEPLLGGAVIDAICRALADAGVPFESTMISNGSLIDGETARRMAEDWHMTSIQLSMDCAEEEYIRRKNYYRYHDEYHTVMGAADLLTARGIRVIVRCNVDAGNMGEMPVFLRELDAAVTDKRLVSVYFLPLYEVQENRTDHEVWAACAEAEGLIRARGFGTRSGVRVRRLKTVHCMADLPHQSVVIAPDGALYNCEHCPETGRLGHVREGVTNTALVDACTELAPAREECRGCTFLPECMTFPYCPVKSAACREHQRAWLENALRHEILSGGGIADPEETDTIC